MQSLLNDPVTVLYWRRATRFDEGAFEACDDAATAIRTIEEVLAGGDATAAALSAFATSPIDPPLRAHARLIEGCLEHRAGHWEAAQLALNRAIEAYGDIGLRAGAAVARIELASVAESAGAIDAAVDRYRVARTLLGEVAGDAAAAATARAALIESLDATLAACTARVGLMDELLAAGTDALPALLARHRSDLDDRFTRYLSTRSMMLLGDDASSDAAIAAALLCDRVDLYRGLPPTCCRDLGRSLLEQRSLRLSARLFEAALDLAPGDHGTRIAFAFCLSLQERVDEARLQLETVVEAEPANAVALRHLGMILLRTGDRTGARTWLERAHAIDPDDSMTSLLLDRLVDAGAPTPALPVSFDPVTGKLAIADEALHLPPDELALLMTAAILKALPDAERAARLVDLAKDHDATFVARIAALLGIPPERPDAFEQAETAFGLGRYEEATALYREAIVHDAQNADAFSGLADCHFHRGRFHLASVWFEESLAIRPSAPVSRFLGHALWSGGRRDEAIVACQRSIAIDPTYGPARQQLAQMLEAMGAPA